MHPSIRESKPYILRLKDGTIRLTKAKGEIVREWLRKEHQRFLDLTDDHGNYWQTLDKSDVKGGLTYKPEYDRAETGGQNSHKGYYCEWGAYHYFDEPSCGHWLKTGVPPEHMVKARKILFPNWADGLEGRPPRGYQGNAMTQTMQNACVVYAKENLITQNDVVVLRKLVEAPAEDLPF